MDHDESATYPFSTNQKRYIKWLGKKLAFKKPTDWYQVTYRDFISNRGGGLLDQYGRSYVALIMRQFPGAKLKPWLFQKVPAGFWSDIENCRAYAKWFEKKKKFNSIECWYGMTQDDVFELNGMGLMDGFGCSVRILVNAIYPDHEWLPWRFVQAPNGYWNERDNRVAYMKWLGQHLGYKKPQDWYRVTKADFIGNYGSVLMQYGYKPVDLIRELYPQLKWRQWLFKQVYQGYWNKKSHRLEYLTWLAEKLGYENEEDWLQVRSRHFTQNHGMTLLTQFYNLDFPKLVKELYPRSSYKPWQFQSVTDGFWDDPKNCRSYMVWFAKRLGIRKKTDWYSIKVTDFKKNYGGGFIKRFRKTYFALKYVYPNYEWLPWLFPSVPDGFWDESVNRKWYYAWLGKQLRLKTQEDWLSLKARQLFANGGYSLLTKFPLKDVRVEASQIVE